MGHPPHYVVIPIVYRVRTRYNPDIKYHANSINASYSY